MSNGAAAVGREVMRAATYDEYGRPNDVLRIQDDVPVPKFGKKDVLVEVHVAALNPVDFKILKGNFRLIAAFTQKRVGFDFAGRVVAVGSKCKRLAVGDMVHGMTTVQRTGTLAEYVVAAAASFRTAVSFVFRSFPSCLLARHSKPRSGGCLLQPVVNATAKSWFWGAAPDGCFHACCCDRFVAVGEDLTSKIPEGMDVHQAAAIPLATLTGNSIAKYLRPESRVLVLGGASATGSAAIQVARVHKAGFVATTCSPRSDEYVKSLGADMTVDYRTENVWEVMKSKGLQFDVIFHTTDDVVPGDTFNGAVRGGVLANGGHLISITGDKQQELTVGELVKRGWQLTARNIECRTKHGGAGYHQCVDRWAGGRAALGGWVAG
jgi:NADPH:quinone reductase-like Zn-dependent oxidoreductase